MHKHWRFHLSYLRWPHTATPEHSYITSCNSMITATFSLSDQLGTIKKTCQLFGCAYWHLKHVFSASTQNHKLKFLALSEQSNILPIIWVNIAQQSTKNTNGNTIKVPCIVWEAWWTTISTACIQTVDFTSLVYIPDAVTTPVLVTTEPMRVICQWFGN